MYNPETHSFLFYHTAVFQPVVYGTCPKFVKLHKSVYGSAVGSFFNRFRLRFVNRDSGADFPVMMCVPGMFTVRMCQKQSRYRKIIQIPIGKIPLNNLIISPVQSGIDQYDTAAAANSVNILVASIHGAGNQINIL